MSSNVASDGTAWRMSAACPCNTLKWCAVFSFCVKLFWNSAVSNSWWNTAQDVAPSNFGSFTVVILAPGPPPLVPASTAANWASSSRRALSNSSRRSVVQPWRLHFPVVYQVFLLVLLSQRTNHLFVFQAPPWLLSCNFPSCSLWHVLELWGQLLFCSCQTLLPHICHSSVHFVLHLFIVIVL